MSPSFLILEGDEENQSMMLARGKKKSLLSDTFDLDSAAVWTYR